MCIATSNCRGAPAELSEIFLPRASDASVGEGPLLREKDVCLGTKLPAQSGALRLLLRYLDILRGFWADDVSLTDTSLFDHRALLGPKQITDRYLLALAVKHKGRLVTFDQALRPTAVKGALAAHVVQLGG